MNGSIRKAALDILFPEKVACISCGREAVLDEGWLCAECREGIELFNSATPPEHVDGYSAAFIYNDVSERIVKRLKYGNARWIAKPLSEALSVPADWEFDCIVPVPLYFRRQLKRGYNQSELIAKHLAARLGLTVDAGLLIKTRSTRPQARLTDAERKRNLKDAFASDDSVKGKRIMLLDDVRTTGATLSACAGELKKQGAEAVCALTVCCARGRN